MGGLKIGDTVAVRTDLSLKDNYKHGPGYINELEMYRGTVSTIKNIDSHDGGDWIILDGIPWTWSERWLETIEELEDITDDEFTALLNGD